MNIDIAVPTSLNLVRGHKEFLIKLLVQLVEDQTPFRGHQCRIRIGILLVSYVHDGLALFIYIIQHTHKVLLIIAVIPIALSHHRLHLLQSVLHDIVHHRNGDFLHTHLIDLVHHVLTDPAFLLHAELGQSPIGAFAYGIYDFLHIEGFSASVLLYHGHFPCRFEGFPVIDPLFPLLL